MKLEGCGWYSSPSGRWCGSDSDQAGKNDGRMAVGTLQRTTAELSVAVPSTNVAMSRLMGIGEGQARTADARNDAWMAKGTLLMPMRGLLA